jgi:hypothetical protein
MAGRRATDGKRENRPPVPHGRLLRACPRPSGLPPVASGEVLVLEVRPSAEYAAAHLPHARSLPVDELRKRLFRALAASGGPPCADQPAVQPACADAGRTRPTTPTCLSNRQGLM